MKYNYFKFFIKFKALCGLLLIFSSSLMAVPADLVLKNYTVQNLPEDDIKIILEFNGLARVPKVFSMDEPAELILDFAYTSNGISKGKRIQNFPLDLIKCIVFSGNMNKVRMVLSMKKLLPYNVEVDGNNLILTIKNQDLAGLAVGHTITALDFNRGERGEGKLILDLKYGYNAIDLAEPEKGSILLEFKNATIPDNLIRNFDVSDFGTPIKNIAINQQNKSVFLRILVQGEYDKIAYQMADKYIIEVKAKNELEQQSDKIRKFKFTGEKISLNFQDIEIRAVLQLLADFTGMNIIANDSVTGNVTLRLDNVPWDQVLDFILKSKGLAKRESGNVVLIAPSSELSVYEKMESSSLQQLQELSPLKTEFLKINYAKASEIVTLVKGGDDKQNSILSSRGSISVDPRTNTLLIKDIEEKLREVKDLIKNLDVPVKQVLIEAYIVQATQSFMDSLGINLSGSAAINLGSRRLGIHGMGDSTSSAATSSTSTGTDATSSTGTGTTATTDTSTSNVPIPLKIAQQGISALNNVPGKIFSFNNSGPVNLGFALSRLPGGLLLNLELDLAETESISTNIAKPRVLTLDKQAAFIESGQDIPYQTSSNNNGNNTTFQKASIKLEVTPQITPNNQIAMELSINNDSPGIVPGASQPSIKTAALKTNVLVENGETIVLGGLMTEELSESKRKVPLLADVPLIGKLFRDQYLNESKKELLFFITPKIITSNSKEQNFNG